MPEAASVGGLFSFLLFSLLKQATLDRPLGATRRHSRLRLPRLRFSRAGLKRSVSFFEEVGALHALQQ